MSPQTINITQPDDWHLHLRDGDALTTTVAHTARVFRRAIVMPNLPTPVCTVKSALAYRDRILTAVPSGLEFDPLMTLYLTDNMSTQEIDEAHENPAIHAVKYYPSGATTNSENGVSSIEKVLPILERMQELGLPLLMHGEVTDSQVDIFDREQRFVDDVLRPLLERLPTLKLVLEHITTSDAVQFVNDQADNVAATITAHHLLYNRNHLLAGRVRPHFYCLPVLKRDTHQGALVVAATSGSSKFFLGTDSAPHARTEKETACGCAGIYSAPGAIELYAEVFDDRGAMDNFEGFASFHGADFYGLPHNDAKIQLQKSQWKMPESFPLGDETVIPIRANEQCKWQLLDIL